ncbi:MAG TPA: hypothetical protein VMD99_12170 [Terriglobales bacterium]|nr:hypothetical protein [Terriglobales bacterium]
MRKFYQWLFERKRFFGAQSANRDSSRIIHTQVTVERRGVAVLMDGVGACAFQTCPLCGQELQPDQAEKARLRLRQTASSQQDPQAKGAAS